MQQIVAKLASDLIAQESVIQRDYTCDRWYKGTTTRKADTKGLVIRIRMI